MDFLDVLCGLWDTYTHAGAFFVIVHGFVAATILHLLVFGIRSERIALISWPEPRGSRNYVTLILDQFVEESRTLGQRGVLIPAGDLSERLNSRASVYVDRLHSRVNLFLVVGVAGTFYAMFSFIFQASRQGVPVTTALESGLMQGFPIGFFGLVWTFLGHYAAFRAEESLRDAVNVAVGRAMKLRTENLQTPVDQIATALAPLKDLQKTLQDTLAPVIEGFREQLKLASELMGRQVEPLASAITEFRKSAADLKAPIERLGAVVEGLPENLSKIALIQQQASGAVKGMVEAMGQIQAALGAAAAEITSAIGTFSQLPAQLTAELRTGLSELHSEARNSWIQSSQEFFTALKPACEALDSSAGSLDTAAAKMSALAGSVEQAVTESMQSLLDSATTRVSEAVGRLTATAAELSQLCSSLKDSPAQMTTAFQQHCRSLAERSAQAWQEASERFLRDVAQRAETHWTNIRQEAQNAAAKLKSAADELIRVSNAVDEILQTSLRELHSDLVKLVTPHLRTMQQAVSIYYPQVLANLSDAAQRSGAIAEDIERVRASLASASDQIATACEHWQRLVERLSPPRPEDRVPQELRAIREAIQSLDARIEHLHRDLAFPGLRRLIAELKSIADWLRRRR